MIDMVFLLLVFFMVTAKPIRPEADISLGLPGALAQDEPVDLPQELVITIADGGHIVVNEQGLDLEALQRMLVRFQVSSRANHSEVMVTIDAADAIPHQRLVDVLDACAAADITAVTFADIGGGE